MQDTTFTPAERRELSMAEAEELARGVIAEHGGELVLWSTPVDNYDPPRHHAGSYGVVFARPVSGIPAFKFWPSPSMTHAYRALYLLDNGHTVVPYSVAGWQSMTDPNGWMVLEPVQPGAALFDPPHSRPTSAALGPRMTYHLIIRPAPAPAPAAPAGQSYADVVCGTLNANLRNP